MIMTFQPAVALSEEKLAELLSSEPWVVSAEHIKYYDEREGILNPNVSYVLATLKSGDSCKISVDYFEGVKVRDVSRKDKKLVESFFAKIGYKFN
jgi:hypothetical protein